MTIRKSMLLSLLAAFLLVPAASAGPIVLFDWGFNVDGVVYTPSSGALPAAFDTSLFDFESGIGTITLTVTGTGMHNVIGFFDHELNEEVNGFTNEYGSRGNPGSILPGQTWEMDEPGFVFGDIYANLLSGALDNSNAVGQDFAEDVSMALGWSFNLDEGVAGVITFVLAQAAPGGYYLQQTDNDDVEVGNIYFSSTLSVGGEPAIPEPGTWLMVVTGVGLAAAFRKRLT